MGWWSVISLLVHEPSRSCLLLGSFHCTGDRRWATTTLVQVTSSQQWGTLPIQGLSKISNSPVLLCIGFLKSQLCLEGRQLWLAGTYSPPVPQELSLSSHLGLWSQPMSRSRDVGFIPLCCQPLVSTQPFPITGTVYKGCKGGGYGRFSLAKKSQEK